MKVSDVGEFGLIELLAKVVGQSPTKGSEAQRHLWLGIGDDAAAWRTQASVELGTTDTLIQDVHFSLETTTWGELGWKALGVNLSDIAAMGGIPQYALVALGLPGDTEVESVTELYKGMLEMAREFDVVIIGGDVSAAPQVIISLTVLGNAIEENILTRSAAMPGDHIAVTGYLGSSAAGLKMLSQGLKFDRGTTSFLREAHLRPQPRVAEGQTLARHGVRTAIDVSDGLISDLIQVCKVSGVGAWVRANRVPVHPLVRATFEKECLEMALSGGEDYELLFTARNDIIDEVKGSLLSPVTVIGQIVSEKPGRVTLLDNMGNQVEIERAGWDHFSPSRG